MSAKMKKLQDEVKRLRKENCLLRKNPSNSSPASKRKALPAAEGNRNARRRTLALSPTISAVQGDCVGGATVRQDTNSLPEARESEIRVVVHV
jgi:hypothetical protein